MFFWDFCVRCCFQRGNLAILRDWYFWDLALVGGSIKAACYYPFPVCFHLGITNACPEGGSRLTLHPANDRGWCTHEHQWCTMVHNRAHTNTTHCIVVHTRTPPTQNNLCQAAHFTSSSYIQSTTSSNELGIFCNLLGLLPNFGIIIIVIIVGVMIIVIVIIIVIIIMLRNVTVAGWLTPPSHLSIPGQRWPAHT